MTESELVTAQNLIRDLRAELYSTRNSQKEARAQCEAFRAQLTSAQSQLRGTEAEVRRLSGAEAALKEGNEGLAVLQNEVAELKGVLEHHSNL